MMTSTILFQDEKSNQIELKESYRPVNCALNLVRISEFFNNILEKQPGKTEWNSEIFKLKGTLLHLVN